MPSNAAAGIVCDACGFDMGDSLTDSGRCLGCGVPLGPSDDHNPPAPGFEVPTRDRDGEPCAFVPEDHDREAWPELEGVRVVKRLSYEFGRGIGAEPYGYHTTERVEVVDLGEWNAAAWFRGPAADVDPDIPDACPTCGATDAIHRFSQDRAGICGSRTLSCAACGEVLHREAWD